MRKSENDCSIFSVYLSVSERLSGQRFLISLTKCEVFETSAGYSISTKLEYTFKQKSVSIVIVSGILNNGCEQMSSQIRLSFAYDDNQPCYVTVALINV